MSYIKSFFEMLLNLNSAVLIPFFLLLFALIAGAKFGKALRAALTVGVGFIGISTLTNLFFTVLAPVVQSMVERWGLSLNIIDVGWGPFMGASNGTSHAAALRYPEYCVTAGPLYRYTGY